MAKREPVGEIPLSRFGVLVAQLESVAASARQQPPDALLCFDLLSELVTAIEESSKESILQWQRKCEDALFSLLTLGARRPIRRLASSAMGMVIAKGDGISIYSRASSLQGWLADSKKSEPLSCAGVAQCLGELYRLFGHRITSGLIETSSIAAKLMKFHEDFVRQDSLQMLENALEGSCGNGASTAYSEAFRLIMRVGVVDKSFIVRLAAARCLKTFASIGGPGLGITELENSITCCLKALEDQVSSVRDAFSEALGTLLALAMNPEKQVKQKGKSHSSTPTKKLDDGLHRHLILPFTKGLPASAATGVRAKDLRIGLTLSFVYFLQVIRLKYRFQDVELQNYALQAMDMLHGNASLDAHALACVLYVLRVGVTDQMTEPTQRSFLVLLGRKLESADYIPSARVATLRILSYLLTTLGEVPVEFKEVLDNTVVAALSHPSLHVRTEAALMLRALVEVDPICVGGLIAYGATTLRALRESVAFEKGNHFNFELDSLHGQAAMLAALVSIAPKLLLGYPAGLPKSLFEVSKKMLTEFSRNPVAATVEKEAGWLLLASLIACMPKEELEDHVFDVLLLWADPFVGSPDFLTRETDLTSDLRVLSAAIEALIAFIRNFVSPPGASTNGGVLLQPVLAYLSGALSYISFLSAKQLQSLKPALDLFTIRTLVAYQSLPNPMAYKSEHPQIMQICTSPFNDPSKCEESSCLRFLLDKRDACLGPWRPGRDWFEDELRAFDGGKDGVMPCIWDDQLSSFPQPESISKMLVNQMLLCFGTIFASQDHGGKLMLLNIVDKCLKMGKKQSWHVISVTNACVALLTGLKAVLVLRPPTLGIDILSSMQSIFQGILAEGEICASQQRASCEGLGLLARLGNDMFTARMMRSLLGELVVGTDPTYTGSIALSLGCIHRSAGGMALSALVPASVNSISVLARSSNTGLQLWSLHAILLTIEAAGLSYVSQVQATLSLAIEILLSEENGLIDLRQEIGRLINAIVVVLGPELVPGSTFFSRCKSFIAEISSCHETSTLLESVRFTQQLVLFAPKAVSVHSHIQNLLPTLSSRQPSLRYLAISTLHHLIEKDPASVICEKIEESLFSMLDEETDTEIGSLLRSTITRLLYASCPSCPSRWLTIFHNMVLATSMRRNAGENGTSPENNYLNGTPQDDNRLFYGQDDGGMIDDSSSAEKQFPSSNFNSDSKRVQHLRYRTRVFAAECLSYAPTAVGTDPAHFDLSLARRQMSNGHIRSNDWLVLHLQEIISLAYQVSTGQFEGMQHIGVRLLSIIMDKYEKIPDPDLPGHLLLEQYQAQLVSAVRSAITMSSGPLLLEAGLQLATKILTSGIIGGDRLALNRLFSLISRPLSDIKDLYYPSFAEWVACKIKIRLLAAHASIKCFVYSFLREIKEIPDEYLQLLPLLSSNSSSLGKYWISILKDYCYICFHLHSSFKYTPFLEGIQSPLVSSKLQNCLDEAWPLILQAIVLDAVPLNAGSEESSECSTEESPKDMLLSGYSMVGLDATEYQFLLGFALLITFQERQPGLGKELIGLLAKKEKKHVRDLMLPNMQFLTPYEIALPALLSLSKKVFFSQHFLTLDLCRDFLQGLIYAPLTANSWNSGIICLLCQIVQFCPDGFFKMDDFMLAATQLCCRYLYFRLRSKDPVLQDQFAGKDLITELSISAETIARRMNHKDRWKLGMAYMSICRECFREASTNLCISKVIRFLWNIMPSLKRSLRETAECGIDEYAHLSMAISSWVSMLAFLSQDCIRRIHTMENEMGDSFKLLIKVLASCLEEAVALARLVYETKDLLWKNDNHKLQCHVYKHCVRCIQNTFHDTNVQVRAVGLNLLKGVAQRGIIDRENHSFLLFFIGELVGDIFLLIQNALKEHLNRQNIALTEECLRLLFLFHTLSQGSECQRNIMNLLLETLLTVFAIADGSHSLEFNEVKTISRRLVSHLIQIPSFATHVKDTMLSMPVKRRQQLQDIIRMAVTQDQMAMKTKPISQPPMSKLNVYSEAAIAGAHQLHALEKKTEPAEVHSFKEEAATDDDEDWDAFQSLPANNASAPTSDRPSESAGYKVASTGNSLDVGGGYQTDDSIQHRNADLKVSKELGDVKNTDAGADEEMRSFERRKPITDLQHADDGMTVGENYGYDEEISVSCQPEDNAKQLLDDPSIDEGEERVMECKSDRDDKTQSSSQLCEDFTSETNVLHCQPVKEEQINSQDQAVDNAKQLLDDPSIDEAEERVMECKSDRDDKTQSSSQLCEDFTSETNVLHRQPVKEEQIKSQDQAVLEEEGMKREGSADAMFHSSHNMSVSPPKGNDGDIDEGSHVEFKRDGDGDAHLKHDDTGDTKVPPGQPVKEEEKQMDDQHEEVIEDATKT